jgi:hypothetical protein
MARVAKRLALATVLFVAIIIPLITFWLGTSPVPVRVLKIRVAAAIFRVLDAPTSALNAILPWSWRSGLAHQFAETPARLARSHYLLIGFVAYLLLGWGLLFLYRSLASRSGIRTQDASDGA